MKLPFDAHCEIHRRFTLDQVRAWIMLAKPTQIEMTDAQYFWLCELTHGCPRQIEQIPIVFIDAPVPRI